MKTKSYYPHAPKNRDPDAQHKKPAATKPEAKRRGAKPGVRPTARPGARSAAPQKLDKTKQKSSELDLLLKMGRWVIGIHAAEEALRVRPHAVKRILLREDWKSSEQLKTLGELAGYNDVQIIEKTQGQIDGLLTAAQAGSGHQGVLVIVGERPKIAWNELKTKTQCVLLALDGLEDPQNLGSILRTSWLMNVDGIIVPQDRAAHLTPTVSKVASGGAEHVALESVSNLGAELKQLKDQGFWIYGLSEKGTQMIWDVKLPHKVVWVIGNEASGMRVSTENFCDELVRIPQVESGSSYNAGIATAIALAESARQMAKIQN
jgi:23S rRNA (guanosine2251-2'-O)-methyltransferase